MSTLKDFFVNSINEGMKAAKTIQSAGERATAYASIAQAIALSGLLNSTSNVDAKDEEVSNTSDPAPVQTPAKANGKAALGAGTKNTKAPATTKAPVAAPEKQPELVAEWTDEMYELLAEPVAKMKEYVDTYPTEVITECISQFSEGSFAPELDNITPLNITAFVSFMDALASQA